jgi:tRNA threonylcarbamoyladenosine biosynthesis protein TsaE
MQLISQSPAQTFELGKWIGEHCQQGDVLLLTGELGSGKTLFTKGLAGGLGIDAERVLSPSFTIIFEHTQGRLPLYHMDFYRLNRIEELEDLGLERYFAGDGVLVVEWADRVAGAMPAAGLAIHFDWQGEQERRIVFSAKNDYWQNVLAQRRQRGDVRKTDQGER